MADGAVRARLQMRGETFVAEDMATWWRERGGGGGKADGAIVGRRAGGGYWGRHHEGDCGTVGKVRKERA